VAHTEWVALVESVVAWVPSWVELMVMEMDSRLIIYLLSMAD
jgi:hypothetical protein